MFKKIFVCVVPFGNLFFLFLYFPQFSSISTVKSSQAAQGRATGGASVGRPRRVHDARRPSYGEHHGETDVPREQASLRGVALRRAPVQVAPSEGHWETAILAGSQCSLCVSM